MNSFSHRKSANIYKIKSDIQTAKVGRSTTNSMTLCTKSYLRLYIYMYKYQTQLSISEVSKNLCVVFAFQYRYYRDCKINAFDSKINVIIQLIQ